MTISSTTVKNSYNGNGSTRIFSYTFKIFQDSDLQVIIRSANGTETIKTLNTHYTVSGAGNSAGGSITFLQSIPTYDYTPLSTEKIIIRRNLPQTQSIDYIANDTFPAESHEEGLDRAMMAVQQLQEEVTRSIKLSRTNTMNSTEFTVDATSRANKILAFDASGEIAVTQELGSYKGNWTTATSYSGRDLVKDTSNNNIYYVNTAHTSSGSQPLSSNANSAYYILIVDAAAAATSASNAATSASNAATSATNASNSASSASTSATNSANSATSSAGSATTATTQATNAASSATSAASSASTATTKASEASTSATNAASSASSALSSKNAAATSATAAQSAQTAVETIFDNFDDRFLGSKTSDPTLDNDGNALVAGTIYYNSVSSQIKFYNGATWDAPSASAATSATNAATSATNAATSATAAAASATTASTQATNASNSATSASSSASTATTQASTATTQAGIATTQAGIATTKASEASSSATSASSSASTATTKASEASTSATNAASSASSASSSATTATSQASAASTSASNAATSATSASTSATNASTSATNASTTYTNFLARYLGTKTSDPTLDNNGSALIDGALYYDTVNNRLKVYDLGTTTWLFVSPSSSDQTNINTVSSNITNVNTVATNISGVNNFSDRYRVSSSAPSTSLDVGDLYFDTTSNTMKVYSASGWQNAGSSVNGTSARFQYTLSGSQTTFTGADDNTNVLAYDPGYIDIYLNGVRLNSGDYTASNGTSIVLASAAASGDVLYIVAYGTFSITNISASNITSGTLSNSRLTGNGTITINGSAIALGGSVTTDTRPTITSISPSTITNDATSFTITGTNFVSVPIVEAVNSSTGAIIRANSVSFTSSTSISANFTLTVDGTYFVRVENNDGNAVRSTNAILTVSDAPIWSTAAGTLGTFSGGGSVSATVAATSDSAVSYSVYSGSLPGGLSLNSSTGVISGTESGATADTTYSFTIRATDAETQTADRSFSITITVGINNGVQFN